MTAAAVPWFEIFKVLAGDPSFLYEFANHPRKFEAFIAGAYREAGFDEVTLTPRSGDGGIDVIAVMNGLCSIRVLDQTKAYSSGHLVTHDDVRTMLGVLSRDQNASKGLITTTSGFAPTVVSGNEFSRFMPHRLELKDGQQLLQWLLDIRANEHAP